MKPLEKFVVLFVVGMILGIGVMVGFEDSRQRQVDAPAEFVPIGNGIERTDDRERGVSCYRLARGSSSLSCVGTGVGLVGDLAQ